MSLAQRHCFRLYLGGCLIQVEPLVVALPKKKKTFYPRNILCGHGTLDAVVLAGLVQYIRRLQFNFERVDGKLFLKGYLPWEPFPSPQEIHDAQPPPIAHAMVT